MSIYIITHKAFEQPKDEGYRSLLVGAHRGHIFGDEYDDSGENISEKNSNYCELTGLYWLWKNCKDEYIGITHYRRYFSNHFGNKKILSKKCVENKLKTYDIILPFHQRIQQTIEENYCEESGYKKDLDLVEEIIGEQCPEYLKTYRKYMNGHDISFFNMMICKKEIYDDYCKWLFAILFEVEKRADLTGYNSYQKRIYGFMAERLLNVYVKHNCFKVFEVGVINTEEKWPLKKRFLTGCKRVVLYHLK
ncbi:DUF4422 domain-containing protein [Clostridium diolis]|uniref:Exopolysaccharide biosynthesis protein n=1 Tax=Clostridium diolis TaxID=223919 RepID=A0AAV3VVU2_9CLOT|nr:DUF4422 domain-containing protein [Clostridium diolis]QES72332.1 DUF4422 domain-containing protein [Clostridium diolis]GEA30040.1 exopolysaccharide biosynthesis protein [Clostridium diolis]